MSPFALQITIQILGTLFIVVGGVWKLSSAISRMAIQLELHSKMMETRFSLLDREMEQFKIALQDARRGRAEIWDEVNNLRERAARLENAASLQTGSRR